MEHISGSRPQKRCRVSWKNINVVKTFLETCINEVAINGKEGGALKAHSWNKVAENLKNTHNFVVDRKQMRNHFDYLKGKYGAWLKLKNKTGNVYDPSTNTFNLTDEEWEMEMETNRYVESLRTTNLPFPELCAQLFEGGMATGIRSHGPSSLDPEPTIEPFTVTFEDHVEMQGSNVQQATSSYVGKNKRKATKQSSSTIDEDIMIVLKSLAEKNCNPPPNSYEPPTFSACLKKLQELGWGKEDPLFRVALAILNDKDNREAWMEIPPEFLVDWVKTVGQKQGYMKY